MPAGSEPGLAMIRTLRVLAAVAAVNYLVLPITGDARATFAHAYLADAGGAFWQGLVDGWVLRPVGTRLMTGWLYWLWQSLFDQPLLFEIAVRATVLALLAGALWLLHRPLRDDLPPRAAETVGLAGFAAAGLSAPWLQLQSESFAVLFTYVMAAGLLFGRQRAGLAGWGWAVAAAAAAIVAVSMKYVTSLYVVAGLAAVLAVTGWGAPVRRSVGRVVVAGVLLGVPVLWWMQAGTPDVADTLEATRLQQSARYGLAYPVSFAANFLVRYPLYDPVAFVAMVVVAIGAVTRFSRWERAWTVLAGVAAVAYVVIQAKNFTYHFLGVSLVAVLLLPAALRHGVLARERSRGTAAHLALAGALALGVLHAGLLSAGNYVVYRAVPALSDVLRPVLYNVAPQDYVETASAYRAAGASVRAVTSPGEAVLYLSDGSATYFARRPSHSRYFIPLPVQRAVPGTALRESELYRDVLAELIAYDGPAVVVESWFGLDQHPELATSLESRYRVAYTGTFADGRTITVLHRASGWPAGG